MSSSFSQGMLGKWTTLFVATWFCIVLTAVTVKSDETQTCGKSQNVVAAESHVVLIHHARNASLGDFPWMAALYTPLDEGKWTQICGGTLIAPHLVLTAAHCLNVNMKNLEPRDIKVGLGKIIVDLETPEIGGTTVAVKQVVIPERYAGMSHMYTLDIALLVLAESVKTNSNIMPACIDWKVSNVLQQRETGYFAGYAETETYQRRESLTWEFLKYITYKSCLNLLSQSNVRFFTHDKFCATGEEGGTEIGRRFAGGGVTFVRNGSHYVYGLLSSRPLSIGSSVRFFTDVTNPLHLYWLKEQWQQLHN